METVLQEVYVIKHIDAILKLVPRPPIVMINHDLRFLAFARKMLRTHESFVGYDAVGAYLALDSRIANAWMYSGPWFLVQDD